MDDIDDLVRQLCTKAGCVMEDTSVVALIWDDGLSIDRRLENLVVATNDIVALIAAAKAVQRR